MIYLPNVTLILIGDTSSENHYAWGRSRLDMEFGDVNWIPPLPSYKAYNQFVINELHKHFTTSHCLLIQADGFVWHADQWRDEFLQYDYIGAVMWNGFVGNGGFSLRSRRFCEASARLGDIAPPVGHESKDAFNEDALLCISGRKQLEQAGMVFAPEHVADEFSWELSDCRPKALYSFGLHGKHTIERAKALRIL